MCCSAAYPIELPRYLFLGSHQVYNLSYDTFANIPAWSYVKSDNIESAWNLLKQMYSQVITYEVVTILQRYTPPVPEKGDRERFLFAIKIIRAEGLFPLDIIPYSKLMSYVKITD